MKAAIGYFDTTIPCYTLLLQVSVTADTGAPLLSDLRQPLPQRPALPHRPLRRSMAHPTQAHPAAPAPLAAQPPDHEYPYSPHHPHHHHSSSYETGCYHPPSSTSSPKREAASSSPRRCSLARLEVRVALQRLGLRAVVKMALLSLLSLSERRKKPPPQVLGVRPLPPPPRRPASFVARKLLVVPRVRLGVTDRLGIG